MILSDASIIREIEAGNLKIDPQPSERDFSPSSVDVHLGDIVRVFKTGHPAIDRTVDLTHPDIHSSFNEVLETIKITSKGYAIQPQQFLLSYTKEYITLPAHIAARLEGRSTIARYGISVHINAPTVHPFFEGNLVLEICNLGQIACSLKKGMPVGQLIFEYIDSPPLKTTLDTVWQGQRPPNLPDIKNS